MHELHNPKSAAANIELTLTLAARCRSHKARVGFFTADLASQKWFHPGHEARN
jgi:hypothetical protein